MNPSDGAVHEHDPKVFHHTFGAHEPVLTVSNGDRIRTSTLDASGRDANDVAVTEPGNPLTGPFYVNDAMPGDTLVVHLRSVRPNRRRGFSSPSLAPVTVEPELVSELESTRRRIDWDIDVDAGSTRPQQPLATLEDLTVPLLPMLGCIGVGVVGGWVIAAVMRRGARRLARGEHSLRGQGLDQLWPQTLVLIGMTVVFLTVSIRSFNIRLEQ